MFFTLREHLLDTYWSSVKGTLTSLCCYRTRDGHVRFWKVPLKVPSLVHLCRSALRLSISTQQVQALPIPRRILDYLTYRNIPNVFNEPIWDS